MNGNDIDAAYNRYANDPTPAHLDAVIRAVEPVCMYWAKKRLNLRRTVAIDLDDLLQEARMGVVKAVRSYSGQSRFCSWSTLWVRAQTVKHIEKIGSLITGRRSEYHLLVKRMYRKTRDTIDREQPGLTRDELHVEMAKRLGVSIGHIEIEYTDRNAYIYLDAPRATEGTPLELTLIDRMRIGTSPTDDVAAARIALQRVAARAERITNPYWRAFADNLLADQPETDTAMGKRFGTTRARAGQVKELVRDQLREALV